MPPQQQIDLSGISHLQWGRCNCAEHRQKQQIAVPKPPQKPKNPQPFQRNWGDFGTDTQYWREAVDEARAQSEQRRAGGRNNAFGEYMKRKKASIFRQIHENVKKKSNLFKGLSIHIDGYTNPFPEQLQKLFIEHGGHYHHYPAPGETTFVVAQNLSDESWGRVRPDETILKPQWITESIRRKRVLPAKKFLLCPKRQHKIKLRATRTHLPINQLTMDECLGRERPTKLVVKPQFFRKPRAGKKKDDRKRIDPWLRGDETEKELEPPKVVFPPARLMPQWTAECPLRGPSTCRELRDAVEIGGIRLCHRSEAKLEALDDVLDHFRGLVSNGLLNRAKVSVSLLERVVFGGGGGCVHSDWPVVVVELKRFVNAIVREKFQAAMFPEQDVLPLVGEEQEEEEGAGGGSENEDECQRMEAEGENEGE